jgi:hypothetical protein
VTVPRRSWGTAADVHVADEAILQEESTVTGRTRADARAGPAANLAMPMRGGIFQLRQVRAERPRGVGAVHARRAGRA